MEWEEKGVIGDTDPAVLIRKLSASELTKRREEAFAGNPELRPAYLEEFEGQTGSQAFLNAVANYPLLKGSQTNQVLSAFFLEAWRFKGARAAGFHPEGFTTTRKGENCERYVRAAALAFSIPERSSYFSEVDHETRSASIFTDSSSVNQLYPRSQSISSPRRLTNALK